MYLQEQRAAKISTEFYSNPIYDNLNEISSASILIPNNAKSAHSSSIVDIGDRLMILYFAGSKEGAGDVAINQVFIDKKTFSIIDSRELLTRFQLAKNAGKFIKKLGNPVAFIDSKNRAHLFVVGASLGGWATSKIYQFRFSSDFLQLDFVKELHLGSFLNFSHLVRAPAVLLKDGGFMLPFYHELARKYGLVAFFDKNGDFVGQKRMNDKYNLLQPSVVALDSSSCLAGFRNFKAGEMKFAFCSNTGKSWNPPQNSILLNIKNSIFLIHNDGGSRRDLSLYRACDVDFLDFRRVALIDRVKDEASYPSYAIDSKFLYIAYTYNRTAIKLQAIDLRELEKLESTC